MKRKFGQNNFAYKGTTIWNSLPNDCRTAHSFPTFIVKLKAMLAEHYLFLFKFYATFSVFFLNIIGLYFSFYITFSFYGGPLGNQQC